MDPEIKHQLEELHALVRDNHHLLRAIRRHQLIMDFGKFFLWLALVIAAFFFYQVYVRPQVDAFQVNGVTTHGPFGLPTFADLEKLINSYKAGQ
jgi:hypothetical protein